MSTLKTKYCSRCEKHTEGSHEKRVEKYTVRGEQIAIELPLWVCSICGESSVEETFGDPVMRAFDEYRARHGLLTATEIRRIRQRWYLSQAAFAALLGMSQATINRYELGALQSKKEDELIRACDNPQHMHDLLKRGKNRISARQIKGAIHAVEMALGDKDGRQQLSACTGLEEDCNIYTGFRRFDADRYAAVVVWFCDCVQALTQTKLYKLLFYADFLAFRTSALSLTGAAYRAMPYGPVPDRFNVLRSELEFNEYVCVREVTYQNGNTGEEFTRGDNASTLAAVLTDADIAILRRVRDEVGGLTPTQISDRSHEEPAWRDTPRNQPISYEKARQLSLHPGPVSNA